MTIVISSVLERGSSVIRKFRHAPWGVITEAAVLFVFHWVTISTVWILSGNISYVPKWFADTQNAIIVPGILLTLTLVLTKGKGLPNSWFLDKIRQIRYFV